MKAKNIQLIKVNGEKALFNEANLRHSLERSGASELIIQQAINEVETSLYNGIVYKTTKGLGADYTCLVATNLAYMRQDKLFYPADAITNDYFDPNLQLRRSLSEVYQFQFKEEQAANLISAWIKNNVENSLLDKPDGENNGIDIIGLAKGYNQC